MGAVESVLTVPYEAIKFAIDSLLGSVMKLLKPILGLAIQKVIAFLLALVVAIVWILTYRAPLPIESVGCDTQPIVDARNVYTQKYAKVANAFGPLITIGRAKPVKAASVSPGESIADALKALKAAKEPGMRQITLRQGAHRLSETLSLTADVCGDEKSPIEIVGESGAYISGGQLLDMHAAGKSAEGNTVFQSDPVPWLESVPEVLQMWTDAPTLAEQERRNVSTVPILCEKEFMGQDGTPTPTPWCQLSAVDAGKYMAPDLLVKNIFGMFDLNWDSDIVRGLYYNATNRTLIFEGTMFDGSNYAWSWTSTVTGQRVRLLNMQYQGPIAQQVKNTPAGQFLWNAQSKIITYVAKTAQEQAATNLKFNVPRLTTLLEMNQCKFVKFTGVGFAHTETGIVPCLPLGCNGQAACSVTGAAVQMKTTSWVGFVSCTMSHVGGWGFMLTGAGAFNAINKLHAYDIGAGAVRVGNITEAQVNTSQTPVSELPSDILILNSIIYQTMVFIPSATGILVQEAKRVTIWRNTVANMTYSGISVGWIWGMGPTPVNDILIGFNHIHEIGKAFLSDLGCIYTLGDMPGSFIVQNLCYNVTASVYGGMGLYLDEGTSNVIVLDNFLYNTNGALFNQHYGVNNLLMNNFLALTIPQARIGSTAQTFGHAGVQPEQLQPPAPNPPNPASFNYSHNFNLMMYTGEVNVLSGTRPMPVSYSLEGEVSYRNMTINCNGIVYGSPTWFPWWIERFPNPLLAFIPSWHSEKLGVDLGWLIQSFLPGSWGAWQRAHDQQSFFHITKPFETPRKPYVLAEYLVQFALETEQDLEPKGIRRFLTVPKIDAIGAPPIEP